MRKFMAVLIIGALILQMGCTTKYVNRSSELPKKARVGVLMVDRDGAQIENSIRHNYIHNTFIQHDLVPISMKDVDVAKLAALAGNIAETNASTEIKNIKDFDPILVPSLQEYLNDADVQYLLFVNVRVVALDERIQAVLIRTDNMSIIGSKFYNYAIMKQLCIPLGFVGVGLLVCPWFFLRDDDKARFELVRDMLDEFMY